MRRLSALALVALSACTPFDGSRMAGDYTLSPTEEAFPGARITGEGVTELFLDDGTAVAVPYVVKEDMAVAEADIVLGTADEVTARGAALQRTSSRWSCTVPYTIDPSLTWISEQDFRSAIAHWEQHTGLSFVEDPTAPDRIRVRDGAGCSSRLGRVGGVQDLTLGSTCGRGAAIHEVGHAVGMFHEHVRADRDSHVTVHWDNIAAASTYNFLTYIDRYQAGLDLGPYDLGSIMHYSSFAFSTGVCLPGETQGCSLTHTDGTFLLENQRSRLSTGDIAAIAAMYPTCGGTPAVDDHGDTLGTATVVAAPTVLSGVLTPGDTDLFAVQAPAGHQVHLYTTGTTDTVGDLYVDGVLVATDDTTGEGPNFALDTVATDAALHVGVKGWTAATAGPYTLHVETTAPASGTDDHGDSIAQGTWLQASTSLYGNLGWGDADYFVLDVPEGSQIEIGTSGTTDTVGDLLVDGVQVATDDTSGPGPNFAMAFTTGPGQHVMRVEGWLPSSTGDYILNVDVAPPAPVVPAPTDDHGNDAATATVVALARGQSTTLNAQLGTGDIDVFRVDVTEPVTLWALSSNGSDLRGSVRDASGTLVTTDDPAGTSGFVLQAQIPAGSTYVHVDSATGFTGSYALLLQAD
ncbi:MAG: M12 family metallopeptidase [Myxococcota bacterium]